MISRRYIFNIISNIHFYIKGCRIDQSLNIFIKNDAISSGRITCTIIIHTSSRQSNIKILYFISNYCLCPAAPRLNTHYISLSRLITRNYCANNINITAIIKSNITLIINSSYAERTFSTNKHIASIIKSNLRTSFSRYRLRCIVILIVFNRDILPIENS